MTRYTYTDHSSSMRNPRRGSSNRLNITEMLNHRSGNFSRQENSSSSYRRSGSLSIQDNSSSSNHRSGNLSIHGNSSSSGERVDSIKMHNRPDDRPEGKYEDRTIIVENIRADCLVEDLHKFFSRHGRVLSLRKVNPHDPNLAGCSKDGLLARSKRYEFEGTTLGIYAIVEYCKQHQACFAMHELRWMVTNPSQKDGFRAGLRSMYSYIEPEMDEPTAQDMEIGARDEPRNTNTRIERTTIRGTLRSLEALPRAK